jgi:polyisoprenoid-binding protein YceI
MKTISTLCVLALCGIASCKKAVPGNCTYEYDGATTTLQWTAYKFTEKAGVKGSFSSIKAEGMTTASSAPGVFNALKFVIDTKSVDTKNPDRDQKIAEKFFMTMKNGDAIRGSVVSTNNDSAIIRLAMNDMEKEVKAQLSTVPAGSATRLILKAELNMEDWNAGASIAALNEVCKELHTGKDGLTKLWPDVSLEIITDLKTSCQ